MPQPDGKHYYFEIMLPGAIVGLIVGTRRRIAAALPRRSVPDAILCGPEAAGVTPGQIFRGAAVYPRRSRP